MIITKYTFVGMSNLYIELVNKIIHVRLSLSYSVYKVFLNQVLITHG